MSTAKERVWRLLLDLEWHTTVEVSSVSVGGSEGCRRIRELTEECRAGHRVGYTDIERKSIQGSNQWEYRLVPTSKLPKPVSDKLDFSELFKLF